MNKRERRNGLKGTKPRGMEPSGIEAGRNDKGEIGKD